MSTVTQILICACAVFALLDTVTALDCYYCTTLSNSGPCGDEDFSETKTTSVVGETTIECGYCLKVKAKSGGVTVIQRSCVSDIGTYGADQCVKVDTDGDSGEACLCSTDRCNGVGKLSGSLFVILTVAMFKYLW